MPSAPGIHSLPTLWTHVLNVGQMSVPWFTAASVNIPIIAAINAATASPAGTHAFFGADHISITSSVFLLICVSTMVVILVSPFRRSSGLQLGHGGAETERNHQVEERQTEENRDRVTKPRPPNHLHAVPPQELRRSNRQHPR